MILKQFFLDKQLFIETNLQNPDVGLYTCRLIQFFHSKMRPKGDERSDHSSGSMVQEALVAL